MRETWTFHTAGKLLFGRNAVQPEQQDKGEKSGFLLRHHPLDTCMSLRQTPAIYRGPSGPHPPFSPAPSSTSQPCGLASDACSLNHECGEGIQEVWRAPGGSLGLAAAMY